MNGSVERIDTCRVCGGDDWLDVLSFGDTTLANGFVDPARVPRVEPVYPLEVVVCRRCWLMSLRHVVDPAVLFRDYVYVTSDSALIGDHMRHIVDSTTDRAGLGAGDLVVELGSNVGTQLALFAARGQRVAGVDPARNLAAIAEQRGIPTLAEFFTAASAARVRATHGTARLVLGRQCFAHIHDVHEVLRGATELLSTDGLLVIEVPHLLTLLAQNQFDTIFHEHLSYFSFGTLRTLFAAYGLRMVDVERAPVHGGSLVVFGARAESGHRPSPAVAELLAVEEEHGLYGERAFTEFAARTEATIRLVHDTVHRLVAEGATVAGYGAPSKGCTLLELCGLGADELRYVTDTTPAKQGMLTPATGIPVWAPERARAEPPDYYLLLAWNYADEILAKERDFLLAGGRMIVPSRVPRIVSAHGQTVLTGDGPGHRFAA